jgi:hypothetical protein
MDNAIDRRTFLAAASGLAMNLQGSGRFLLEPSAAGRVLRAPDGRVALEYLTSKPAGSNLQANSACCFHPVNTPSGERITDLAPGDHVHHRGIFLAWHSMEFRRPADMKALGPLGPTHGEDINRGDFWGWGQFAPTQDRVIVNRSVELGSSAADRAALTVVNDWQIAKATLLTETTSAAWRATPAANILDLSYRLTPEGWNLRLNQQPFGGFCVRARNDGESFYTTAAGRVTRPDPHYSAFDLNWPAADWYAYQIALKSGRTVGCAVVDHPSNPASTWHNPRYVWMINPCIVNGGPVNVARGQSLTLRYRVVVFDNAIPTDLINQLSREFRAS